jgi:hypothetical protein
MSIVQGQTTLFKTNILSALENFAVGTPYTYKLALYTANATLNNSTTTYTSTTNEVSNGNGYTTGGQILTISYPPTGDTSNNVAWISFNNVTWTGAITARGALVYNSTTGAACFVLNFGNDVTSTNSFTVTFPTPGSTTAVLTIS